MSKRQEKFLWSIAGLASFITFYASGFLTWRAWDTYHLTWRILKEPLGPVILAGFLVLATIFWFIMAIVYWIKVDETHR